MLLGCLSLLACSHPKNTPVSHTITGPSYDFIVMGDNRPDMLRLGDFINGIGKLDVSTVVHVGDMVQFSSPLGFSALQEALHKYLRPDMQFVPVIGNHDMDGTGGNSDQSRELFNYVFGYPKESLGYRKIDYPNYTFIVLNTYLAGYEKSINETQLQWLNTTLAELQSAPSNKPIFVFMHHPMYPAGHHPPITNAASVNAILQNYNKVRAVFAGHEHLYYHEEVTSGDHKIDYYITGGAGSSLHHTGRGLAVHHILGVNVGRSNPITLNVTLLNEEGDPL